jgi:FkbM family methyltransferase
MEYQRGADETGIAENFPGGGGKYRSKSLVNSPLWPHRSSRRDYDILCAFCGCFECVQQQNPHDIQAAVEFHAAGDTEQTMKGIAKAILPQSVKRWFGNLLASAGGIYLRASCSQEEEDLILERLFGGKRSGFYVDVGAHHPRRFYNTRRFYKRGWRGINIEPKPDVLGLFQQKRKRDINLEYGVAVTEGDLIHFMFNEPALNSFDRTPSEQRQNNQYHIVGTRNVAVKRLSGILESNMPEPIDIDFMSIDLDEYDLQVLKANDGSRFRSEGVLVESPDFDLGNPVADPVHIYLELQNYRLFAKTFNTLFYLDETKKTRNSPGAGLE